MKQRGADGQFASIHAQLSRLDLELANLMAIKWKLLRSGVLWIVFSPLALLMALISTVRSDVVYNVQLALFGTWSACGVISGIGRIAGATWAVRLQIVLSWIAFAAFAVPGIVMLVYAFRGLAGYLFAIAVMVFLTGSPFLIYARRRRRELMEQRSTTVPPH